MKGLFSKETTTDVYASKGGTSIKTTTYYTFLGIILYCTKTVRWTDRNLDNESDIQTELNKIVNNEPKPGRVTDKS